MKRIEKIYIIGFLVFGTLTNLIVSEDNINFKSREDGEFCRSDGECKSNVCRGRKCGGRPKGGWCKEDSWCRSGKCKASKCTEEHWPTQLFARAEEGRPFPTNTKEAEDAGWMKSVNEECVSELGEAWLFQGTRNSMHSITLYFSPQIGDQDGVPGVLTGIQADYYGKIMDGLVGRFFSEKKIDQDGNNYHSVAVGFRDSSKHNLCDNSKPFPAIDKKFIVIAPGMENLVVPSFEKSSDLIKNWHQGSCFKTMGFHWYKSAVAHCRGNSLTYEKNSIVPVVPMYMPEGDISGILFFAPEKMQVWDEEICNPALINNDLPTLNNECFSKMNWWDAGPGLNHIPVSPSACSNLCDDNCIFKDSNDVVTQMHFFFYPIDMIHCPKDSLGNESRLYCRNGKYGSGGDGYGGSSGGDGYGSKKSSGYGSKKSSGYGGKKSSGYGGKKSYGGDGYGGSSGGGGYVVKKD